MGKALHVDTGAGKVRSGKLYVLMGTRSTCTQRRAKGRLLLPIWFLLSALRAPQKMTYDWQVARKFQDKDQQKPRISKFLGRNITIKSHQIE